MALLKRQLHLWHRWLGIASGLLVLLWFGSGIVMMYVPYPALTEPERMAWLEPVDAAALRVSAADAWSWTGGQGMPQSVRLNSVGGRPAYHFLADGRWTSVWADTGADLQASAGLAVASARRAVEDSAASDPVKVALTGGDQWTFGPLKAHQPLYRITFDDAAGSVMYVSGRTGELVRDTTRSERAWNWAGSVIHWIYFTPLRTHGEPWRQVVMWTSGVAFVLVLTGMVLGIWRLRLRRRYAGGRLSPYKGWAGWHHWLGLGVGIVTLTWLFSGWLSVTPFGLFSSPGLNQQEKQAFAGAALGSQDLAAPVAQVLLAAQREGDVLEMEWRRVDGRLYLDTLGRTGRVLRDAQSGAALVSLPLEVLQHAVQAMRPNAPLQAEMLVRDDDYYYSHHRQASFPALRARFLTPDEATVYVDARSGRIVEYVDRYSKWNRWMFNALHQMDLAPLRTRPVWDLLVISLCLLGGVLAVTGLVLGWRRLQKQVR